MRAERMDLECISIGSKAPAVGGLSQARGPFTEVQVSCTTSSLSSSPLLSPVLLQYRACFIERPYDCTGPTRGATLSRPVILMFTGNSDLPHVLLKPDPTVPLL